MTLTITLDPETEQAIERKAARLGITPSEYLQRLAERSTRPRPTIKRGSARADKARPSAQGKPRTGAELLAALDALNLPSGYGDPNIDAQALARQLRKQAETRDWS